MTNTQIDLPALKKLFPHRKVYVRNGDIRFLVTKKSLLKSFSNITAKMLFEVTYTEKSIFLENTKQIH